MRRLDAPPAGGPAAVAGLIAGVAIGTLSITLLFLGMRAVMAIGGACADGGPYVPAQPCPDGTPLAMVGGMFGLFAGGGLAAWSGARRSSELAMLPLLGWPALFLSLGWNFLEFGLAPPGEDGWAWGWLVSGAVFVAMGGVPLLIALRAAPAGWFRRLATPLTGVLAAGAVAGVWLGATLFSAIAR